jgi:hypothetical protein
MLYGNPNQSPKFPKINAKFILCLIKYFNESTEIIISSNEKLDDVSPKRAGTYEKFN